MSWARPLCSAKHGMVAYSQRNNAASEAL